MPANIKYVGNAQKTAQNYRRTLGNPSIGSTYSHTANGKVWVYTAQSTTPATEAAALVAAFNGQTDIPELAEWVATLIAPADILFSAKTPGVPGVIAFAPGGTGAPTYASVSTVVNSSPSDASLAANYSSGVLPAAGDSLFLENISTDVLYNLGGGVAMLLPLIEVALSYTGNIGLNEYASGNRYREYRTPRYWQWLCTTLNIGIGTGGKGSNRLMFSLGATACKINVFGSGNGIGNLPAVQLLGTNAANFLNATNCTVGIALGSDETSTFGTVSLTDEGGSVDFTSGPGLTLTNFSMVGKRCSGTLAVAPTNLVMQGGTLVIRTGNLTTVNIDSGTLIYRGTGAAITMGSVGSPVILGEKGVLDLSEGDGVVTMANGLSMRAGSKLNDPRSRLAGTTITFYGCSPDEVTIVRSQNSTLATA